MITKKLVYILSVIISYYYWCHMYHTWGNPESYITIFKFFFFVSSYVLWMCKIRFASQFTMKTYICRWRKWSGQRVNLTQTEYSRNYASTGNPNKYDFTIKIASYLKTSEYALSSKVLPRRIFYHLIVLAFFKR